MQQTDSYARARERAEAKYSLYAHAAVYAAVMVLLIAINLFTSPGVLWFIWPAVGWGFALALHGVSVLLLADKNAIVETLTERELRRSGADRTDEHPL